MKKLSKISHLSLYIGIIFTFLFVIMIAGVGCAEDGVYVKLNPDEEFYVIAQAKTDGTYAPVILDDDTHALVTILWEHHQVHEGFAYSVSDTVAADTTTVTWQIHTANTTEYAHIIFSLFSTGEALYKVTEGSDRNDGTALYEVNKKRVGPVNIANTIVTRTPTGGTTDGIITLHEIRTGSTGVAGKTIETGPARSENEWVLRPGTKYIISITTFANGIFTTMKLDWYEHEDLD